MPSNGQGRRFLASRQSMHPSCHHRDGRFMATYRLYLLNPRTNRIQGFEEYEADGDVEAIERADRSRDRAPLELWSGCKKIHRIEAVAQSPAPARVPARRLSLFSRNLAGNGG